MMKEQETVETPIEESAETLKNSDDSQTLSEMFSQKDPREELEKMLGSPNVSNRRKQKIRNYITASDYLKENPTVGEMVLGDARKDDETFEEYKDRMKLETELLKQYNQGEVLDNPGGGTYVKAVDGKVTSERRRISNEQLQDA